MPTYVEMQDQIAQLERLAAIAKMRERSHAIAKIRELMQIYDLTADDIDASIAGNSGRRARVPAKYRDPATGATWSGRGRTPRWLEGKERNRYKVISE